MGRLEPWRRARRLSLQFQRQKRLPGSEPMPWKDFLLHLELVLNDFVLESFRYVFFSMGAHADQFPQKWPRSLIGGRQQTTSYVFKLMTSHLFQISDALYYRHVHAVLRGANTCSMNDVTYVQHERRDQVDGDHQTLLHKHDMNKKIFVTSLACPFPS